MNVLDNALKLLVGLLLIAMIAGPAFSRKDEPSAAAPEDDTHIPQDAFESTRD